MMELVGDVKQTQVFGSQIHAFDDVTYVLVPPAT